MYSEEEDKCLVVWSAAFCDGSVKSGTCNNDIRPVKLQQEQEPTVGLDGQA